MPYKSQINLPSRLLVGLVSAALAFPASIPLVYAQEVNNQQPAGAQQLTEAQLAALVAPIALYPDPLVAQILMAATYPLEVGEAYNWQKVNSGLKGDALNQALQQQNWDPSVKSLVSFPPVLGMMGSQLSWTQSLGDAVLAQQSDVMSAIQTLRAKAKASGALQSNAQQTVTTQGSGSGETIVIQPANPQVVYVPTYNPTVVYGAWPYPAYPPYAYYPPGYVAGTALLSFGFGMAVGAALWGGIHWGGGGWGHWGGGWGGGNSITINNNNYNNFNRTTNNHWSGGGRSGSTNWQPNEQRRNANLGGGGGVSRDAQREQLRQNLQRGGLNGAQRGGFGGGEHSGGGAGFGGSERAAGQSRDAQRDQLRQNLNRGGLNGGERGGGNRSNAQGSGGHRDPGGFGDTRHSSFGGGERFGGGQRANGGQRAGGDGRRAGGGSRSNGGGGHFGGEHR